MKDHEFRELVNTLRDVATQYHDHESLRERIRHALSDALKQQAPVAIKIGNYGRAFDGPCIKRAYTYEHQPGNEVALKLGRAAAQASFDRGGDLIDFGLSLLRTLSDEGFGVFGVGAEFFSPVSHTSIKEAIIDDLQAQFDTEGITEGDSGDALIRLSDAIAAVEDNWTGVGDTQLPSVPKPEGFALVNAAHFLAVLDREDWRTAKNRAELRAMLAAAPQPERNTLNHDAATAYGFLWHVNNEPGTPHRYSPERAAYEARKILRSRLSAEERGDGINRARELMNRSAGDEREG